MKNNTNETLTIDKYRLFIGSNNQTGQPEIEKAINLLGQAGLKAFTVQRDNIGIWQGLKEKSFIVEIVATPELGITDLFVSKLSRTLKEGLQQQAILTLKEKVQVIL